MAALLSPREMDFFANTDLVLNPMHRDHPSRRVILAHLRHYRTTLGSLLLQEGLDVTDQTPRNRQRIRLMTSRLMEEERIRQIITHLLNTYEEVRCYVMRLLEAAEYAGTGIGEDDLEWEYLRTLSLTTETQYDALTEVLNDIRFEVRYQRQHIYSTELEMSPELQARYTACQDDVVPTYDWDNSAPILN